MDLHMQKNHYLSSSGAYLEEVAHMKNQYKFIAGQASVIVFTLSKLTRTCFLVVGTAQVLTCV